MRHPEFHQSARGKPESTQLKMIHYSSDLPPFMAEDDFVELLWENGQVVMQGQSNRNKKSSIVDRIPREHVDRVNEKDTRDFSLQKTGRLEVMDSFMHNFSLPGPSSNGQLNTQDDDMVPWMNYPMEDAIPNDYCSEFLSCIPGDNLNSLSVHHSSTSIPRTSGFCQTFRGPFNVDNGTTSKVMADSSDPNRTRTTQFYELLHESQTSSPSTKSRDQDFCVGGSNGNQQCPSENFDFTRLQKQDVATKHFNQSSIGVMNFSHFSRPVALAKANLQSVERLKSNENSSTATSSKTMESRVIQSVAGFPTRQEGLSSPVTMKFDNRSTAKIFRKILPIEQSNAEYQKDASRINMNNGSSNCLSTNHANHPSTNFTKSLSLWSSETERGHEAVVASSSVCSGNSAGGLSNEPKPRDKRKDQEGEESGNHSAGLEDESVGKKKSASTKGTSAKRSRAAEVHNLSERRRRDRINEKMRALQELIPNCNKVDKASMLDEAIEYLKTLQLQVQFFTQMMSMGSGLCMPPMMPPVGMQHMRIPPFAHFSQMGLGMGMRFGYGMGMLDMNGSPNCSLVPVPPMHNPQFRCTSPSVPGPQGFSLMPGATRLPMFGMPRPGLPVPIVRAPSLTCAPNLPAIANPVPEVSTAATDTACPPDAGPSRDRNLGKNRDNDKGVQEFFKDSNLMQMRSNERNTRENQAAN